MEDVKKPSVNLVFQVALCVENLEKTMENWKRIFAIDEASIVCKSTKDAYEQDNWDGLNYNEQPCQFFHRYCRFNLGGIDLELIEPLDKRPGNPYSDFLLQNGGSGIHHLGVKIGNQPVLMQTMRDLGIPRYNYAEMGPVLADGSRKGCTFYDLRRQLGLILECGSVVVGPLAGDPRAGNPSDFISD